ncbi:MAG: MGDG synthase family glycosyltransferase [Anaerolineae bacterium]
MPRFLLIMSDTGGGHRSSAEAVRQELLTRHPEAQVEIADIFSEMERWPFDRFADWYRDLTRLNSVPWGMIYHLTDGPRAYRALESAIWPTLRKAMLRFLRRHPADVIASFHPIPNHSLGRALRELRRPTPLVGVAVDLVQVHAAFWTPDLHRCYVPLEVTRRSAMAQGAPGTRIEVLGGMPIRPGFRRALSLPIDQVREELGLAPNRPVVLLTTGGDGMGMAKRTAEELVRSVPEAQIVAIAGRNLQLQRELAAIGAGDSMQVKGYVHDMPQWMRAADLMVAKSGPNTVCEALVMGLPLVLHTQLRGQEAGTADWVTANGAGVWAPKPKDTAAAVRHILRSPRMHATMSRAARALVKPSAAATLAEGLWQIAYERTQRAEVALATHRLGRARRQMASPGA